MTVEVFFSLRLTDRRLDIPALVGVRSFIIELTADEAVDRIFIAAERVCCKLGGLFLILNCEYFRKVHQSGKKKQIVNGRYYLQTLIALQTVKIRRKNIKSAKYSSTEEIWSGG